MIIKMEISNTNKIVHRVVLSGGPCAGKTQGQNALCNFYEKLGWKVYRVPETATVLLGGGVKFADLGPKEAARFQNNLLKTMMCIEDTFFQLAQDSGQNCLVICDRGTLCSSAYLSKDEWQNILLQNNLTLEEIRDKRYDQIVHLVSAAEGAEQFYSLENNKCRTEGLELARLMEQRAREVWKGHPCLDIIDNSTNFPGKIDRLIRAVAGRTGVTMD
ncbi:unc-132 [Cordylochernes scorpioides]|uniref:Unc-132 n=1 Tax=Cordylochernes scorpioides TaxID=51811 RepID=A0ABY6L8P3_9ARAC|nr:unc-132 [Cordylochernes scorpioides]